MPQNAPPPFVKIQNHEAMGKLIEAWANGAPTPTNPHDLLEVCNNQGVGMSANVTDYDSIEFVRDTPGVFKIRVPSKEALKAAKDMIEADGFAYPIPTYYRDAWGNAQPTNLVAKHQRVLFHLGRIGDYTISSCM